MALGDLNTSFFYRCAKTRKEKNEIRIIKDNNGNWVADQQQMKDIIVNHFQELFQGNQRSEGYENMLGKIGNLPIRLSERHLHILDKPITEEDVRKAVFQMGGLKAPATRP